MLGRLIAALFAGFMLITPCSAQMSKEDAFEAGKQAGRDSTPDYDQIFSDQNTQTVVPHEQGSEEHSKFWADTGSKITDMVVEGVNLLATCMGGAEGPGDQLRCEAVRMLMGASQKKGVKEELVKEDDPMFQIRDAMMKNPEAMAGAWGGEYTDCQEFSLGGGTEFDYETCTEVASVAGEDEQFCTLGRTVVIDPDRLYQCTRTMSQMNSGQCVFGENVAIDTISLLECGKKPENRTQAECTNPLDVRCELTPGYAKCRDAGVVLESVQVTYNTVRSAYVAINKNNGELNPYSNNGTCSLSTHVVEFTVQNLAELEEFRLYRFCPGDGGGLVINDKWVTVQGTTSYVAGNGVGGAATGINTSNGNVCAVRAGTSAYCMTGYSGDICRTYNWDLRGLLKEGANTMTIYARGSQRCHQMYGPYFYTRFICDRGYYTCTDDWDNQCAAHGTVVNWQP